MNYRKIYDQLMSKAQIRGWKKLPKTDPNYQYLENHHIIPKSLNGTNKNTNIVSLTFYEHYIAHLLLVKHYKSINDKTAYFKMLKALEAFANFDYGTARNDIFFASRLFKTLTRTYKMPQETKDKLSSAKYGKHWTENQRKANNAYYKRVKDAGIKLVPWNKGIPIRNDTREKMKRTMALCNKNKGRTVIVETKIKIVKTNLQYKYKNIDFSDFDFKLYVSIPRKMKFKKTDGKLFGKYVRHELLKSFLLTQISIDDVNKIMSNWQKTHPSLNKSRKMCLTGKIKIFKQKFEKEYHLDFSGFDFKTYFEIKNENLNIQRKIRKGFILQYVNETEEKLSKLYFF